MSEVTTIELANISGNHTNGFPQPNSAEPNVAKQAVLARLGEQWSKMQEAAGDLKVRTRREPIVFQWENVGYTLTMQVGGAFRKKTISRRLLEGVCGSVAPGEVLAIMGPTGGGKTTLLNVLAGRAVMGVEGKILLNGKPSDSNTKRKIAYVLQDDVLMSSLTVRETLTYTALLRLPGKMPKEEKLRRVDQIIKELGLEKCQNTKIGAPFMRGISGGERKRVNIGNELLSDPSVIFLDEPTSGLDSSTAYHLVKLLRKLAAEGRTVITTIHQPSSLMYQMFDKLLLLADGKTVYYGPANTALDHFAKAGFPCGPQINPADYMMGLLMGDVSPAGVDNPIEAAAAPAEEPSAGSSVSSADTSAAGTPPSMPGAAIRAQLTKFWEDTRPEPVVPELLAPTDWSPPARETDSEDHNSGARNQPKFPTSFLQQFRVLMARTYRNTKDEIFAFLPLFQVIAISLTVGLLWFQLDYVQDEIDDRVGVVFFIATFWCFFPLFSAIFSFPPERAVMTKERNSGSYRLSSYFLGKTTAEAPMSMILPVLFMVICYWMVGLNSYFPRFLLAVTIILLTVFCAQSLGLFMSTAVMDVKKATVYASVGTLALMLASGFYIKTENIPVWIRWVHWIGFMKYSWEAFLISDLSTDRTWKVDPHYFGKNVYGDGKEDITGDAILDAVGIDVDEVQGVGGRIAVLIGMGIAFRLASYLCLRFLNKPRR